MTVDQRRRSEEAAVRQEARDGRNSQEQIDLLASRPGSSAREVARLLRDVVPADVEPSDA